MALDPQTELTLRRNLKAAQDSGDEAAIQSAKDALEQALSEPGFFEDNMEIPFGIGGALAGAAAGTAIAPGVGTVIGGILGGAAGSAGGSVTEDLMAGREIDAEEAAKEAAISAGFDVAFLGAGKILKPLAKTLGITTSDLFRSFSKAPGLNQAEDLTAGTRESLQQTQNLLEQGDGSLSAFQTGQASGTRQLLEGLGDIGILSSARTAGREARNMKALQGETERILNGLSDAGYSAGELGSAVTQVINEGREAAQKLYGDGLTELQQTYGKKQITTNQLRTRLFNMLQSKIIRSGDQEISELADPVIREIQDMMKFLEGSGNITVDAAISLEKKLNQRINQLSTVGYAGYDDVASTQLFDFATAFRDTIAKQMDGVDPALGQLYGSLKNNYADAMTGLLPKINANLIKRANEGSLEALGKALTTANNTDVVNSFFKSIDTAYEQISKSGVTAPVTASSAAKAKNVIRRSFLQNIFGEDTSQVPVNTLIGIAKKLDNPTQASKFRTILGDAYPDFRRLVNAFADSSAKQESNHFILALRSKELQAGAAGVAGIGTMGFAAPLAVLFTPVALGRIATNRGAVRRLLALQERVNRNGLKYTPELVGSWAAKVIEALPEEDRAAIADYYNE